MDEYLKTLLEQIRCKKARPYIRQELQDHIEDQIEANIHAGMNYEDADAYGHFLRPAGPHFPDSRGHIKRTAQ